MYSFLLSDIEKEQQQNIPALLLSKLSRGFF